MSSQVEPFLAALQRAIPGLTVAYKEESWLMRALAAALPSNARFLRDYTTTLGRTVYVPSRAWLAARGDSIRTVLAHEAVHAFDYARAPVRFVLGYLFPQVLAAPLLLALVVLLGVKSPWLLVPPAAALGAYAAFARWGHLTPATIALYAALGALLVGAAVSGPVTLTVGLLALVALGPWPAPFRAASERRAYAMTLAVEQWTRGEVSAVLTANIRDQFTGGSYYWMDRSYTAEEVRELVHAVREGEVLLLEGPYAAVAEFLIQGEAPRG